MERLSLPALEGAAVTVCFQPELRALGHRLLSEGESGTPVHAGTFLRRRLIVLDSALLASPRECRRILLHELFHFVWLRLGNPRRHEWERLLLSEFRRRARGELGYSAEFRKGALEPEDLASRSRRWREYVCESFCDTAAWRHAGLRRHDEFTLAAGFRRVRAAWLARLEAGALSI